MDTEGIIATVVTILLFALVGLVATLLRKKGDANTYEPPPDMSYTNSTLRRLEETDPKTWGKATGLPR